MSAMIGFLADVSGSMRTSAGGHVNQQGGSWVRSIFKVMDELVTHGPLTNQVFAIGYGAKEKPYVFDILRTVRKVAPHPSDREHIEKEDMLQDILDILENRGAPSVRKWANMTVLSEEVSLETARLILPQLRENETFLSRFVQFLPVECKGGYSGVRSYVADKVVTISKGLGGIAESNSDRVESATGESRRARDPPRSLVASGISTHLTAGIDNRVNSATRKAVREVIEHGLSMLPKPEWLWKNIALDINRDSIVNAHEASKILHGCIDDNKLTDERIDELMATVEPHIYGGAPMIAALQSAKGLLVLPEFEYHTKVLFVLSDGKSEDRDALPDLSHSNVNVVCCYITESSISDPKRLYSTECLEWDEAAKFMFRLSSTVPTQHLPRTIFVRRGWTIETTNNETKLFLQVNHPDLIDDVCKFARDVVCSQDALSDLLATVDLDMYINKANAGFTAKKQEDSTCYANASAAVLHLSMKRIVGRAGGYPDFFSLLDKMIRQYGRHGADTEKVLKEMCPLSRLHCKKLDANGAMEAINAKRPVLARFRLTDEEWAVFSDFFRRDPRGVLTRNEIDMTKRAPLAKLSGHAVVLTSYNGQGLTLMNSWGDGWANQGFFTVQNARVLGLEFIDVYWTREDLKESEIGAFGDRGPRIAEKLMESLTGLRTATFKCPMCNTASRVTSFGGTLVRAICPKCEGSFNTHKRGAHDLALNMYLTSLSREGEEKK